MPESRRALGIHEHRGSLCIVEYSSYALMDGGRLEGAVLTFRDITELLEAIPGVDGAELQMTIQNIFDTQYQSFIGVSQIGRLDRSFAEGREFDAIAASVLGGTSLFGGRGKIIWTVFGVVFLVLLALPAPGGMPLAAWRTCAIVLLMAAACLPASAATLR